MRSGYELLAANPSDRATLAGPLSRGRDAVATSRQPAGRHAFVRGVDPPTVMEALGHTDAAFTLRVYAHAMRRDADAKERLKALVDGVDWAPLGTGDPLRAATRHEAVSPNNAESPADAGLSEDGRGGFRTCDLSRVKRALSH